MATGIGFIGTGGMGRYQAKSFAQVKACRVVAGADLSAASRQAFTADHSGATVYEDHRALLKDKNVQAVVISLPTGIHGPVVADALKAGKAVLCEKPLARTVKQCQQVIEDVKRTGGFLMVAQCRRYDAYWGKAADIIASGALGRPLLWRHLAGGRGPAAPWFMDDQLGGGPLLDGAVHNYDFANLVFGDPVSVVARSVKLTSSTAVDTATAVIEYEKGDQVMLSWAWGVAPGGAAGMDILGPAGTLNFSAGRLDSPELDKSKHGYYCLTSSRNDKSKLVKYPLKDMYVTQARHFLDCMVGKAQCQSPATEAIKAVAVAEAIFKSAKANGKTVKVSW